MRQILQRLLRKPILNLARRFDSKPDKNRIHQALLALYSAISSGNDKKGPLIKLDEASRFIIFSDQHKGARNSADDFMFAEKNYLAALAYYEQEHYHYIMLGDSEELWENWIESVIKQNKQSFEAERKFIERKALTKVFGNHDLYWGNDPLASFNLGRIYGQSIPVYEGVVLQAGKDGRKLDFFLTHGHQGDTQSDGNWFTKWFVSMIWAPLQAFLKINPNTPATNDLLKSLHNYLMYEWVSEQPGTVLITGHTHQPVFTSLTRLERIYKKIGLARKENNTALIKEIQDTLPIGANRDQTDPDFSLYKKNYFNTGCCCFDDGDITGIEISEGSIRLIKWEYDGNGASQRILLEEERISSLFDE